MHTQICVRRASLQGSDRRRRSRPGQTEPGRVGFSLTDRMHRTQRIHAAVAAACAAVVAAVWPGPLVSAPPEPRHGIVRLDGRAVRDDGGVFNPLGATLFWLAWGYKFDRPRLEANLQALRDAGVDYVRALGDVGPGSGWGDREVNPGWPDYASVLSGATDLAYDRYGLRVQWTIFGGVDHLTTADARRALVDRFADLARHRAPKIFAFEIANEGWKNGFADAAGTSELRALGQRLAAATDVMVALSAPPGDLSALCDLYGGAGVDIVTVHYDRNRRGALGVWGPVAQPVGRHPPAPCARPLPVGVLNNEPIGPGSSNEEDGDPLRLALAYVTTFIGGNAAYVLHAAPGVRGGGEGDRVLGRAADFTALPEFDALRRALASARQYTPPGLANWQPVRGAVELAGMEEAMARGELQRGVLVADGARRFGVLLGLRREIELRARVALEVEVLDPATGTVLTRAALAPDQALTVPPRPRDGGDGLAIRATRKR